MKLDPTVRYYAIWTLFFFGVYLPFQYLITKWAIVAALKDVMEWITIATPRG